MVGLLVIDVQNVYLPGQKWACPTLPSAQAKICRLVSSWKGPVAFTRFIADAEPAGVWRDYNRMNAQVNAEPWLNELTDEMKAASASAGARVIDKGVYSAWKSAEVRKALKGVEAVAVVGVVADCCVLSTVFDLIDAGKYVWYVRDAVSGVSAETEAATLTVLKGLEYVHLKILTADEAGSTPE